MCGVRGHLPTGAYSKGRRTRVGLTGDEKCKMVRRSQRRHLYKEPILIQMTRQRVWDNRAAETDSRGKREIEEILFLYWPAFSACELRVGICIKYQGNGGCMGEESGRFEPPLCRNNEQGSEAREFAPSLLFQMHFIIFSFVFPPSVASPWASFAVVSPPLVYRLAMWLVVLNLVSSGHRFLQTEREIGVQWCVLLV